MQDVTNEGRRGITTPPSAESVTSAMDGKHQRPELVLRRSIPSLRTPLSTLRLQPHDRTRMTWGRCDLLRLHRDGLAPSTFRRSPGAPVHSINSGLYASRQVSFVLMTGTSGRSGHTAEHLRGPELVTLQLDGGSSSIHGEFRALNETSAIRRKEDNGFSNLVGCGRTPRRCLSG